MPRKPPRNFRPEPFGYHEEVELTVDTLTNLGVGLGRIDGWVVMVPYALPGERVRARVWRNKANFSDADLVEVLDASPDRVEAGCPLFGECGGCQYQHLRYAAQLDWKRRQIAELLQRLGGLRVDVEPCVGSPRIYGYRSKLTPHFRRAPEGDRTAIGFQRADSRAVVDVPACPIASEAINTALPSERSAVKSGARPFKRGGTLMLRDVGGRVETDPAALVEERVGEWRFRFVAGEFFQNNPHVLPLMVDHVLSEAAAAGVPRLVDAYCGVGVFGICGANRFQKVHGIEISARAVALARQNADLNGITNIDFIEGGAERVFAGLDFPGGDCAVILDPPRKGCDPAFLEQLLAFAPRGIVYVSCGPDTQARDLRVLTSGPYQVSRVQPFDLFPHTRHVENVVTLGKIKRRRPPVCIPTPAAGNGKSHRLSKTNFESL